MADDFSARCADLLSGSYDCVDRIVLNAYMSLCHSPGGFRVWWRRLHDDSDDHLDNAHLMRMAGRFSRRLAVGRWPAHARGHGLLVHVQRGTARDQHVHPFLLTRRERRPRNLPADNDSETRARGDNPGCPAGSTVMLGCGLLRTTEKGLFATKRGDGTA